MERIKFMAVTIRKDENGNCHAVFDDIPDEQINKRRKFLKLHNPLIIIKPRSSSKKA